MSGLQAGLEPPVQHILHRGVLWFRRLGVYRVHRVYKVFRASSVYRVVHDINPALPIIRSIL